MKKDIGFKFVTAFPSNIHHFEVRGYDKEKDLVLTTVYTKDGQSFEDSIEAVYYDAAFDIGDYRVMSVKASTQYNCEECGKFLFTSDKPRGAAGAECLDHGFVFKIPFMYGIGGSHFFCSKECWNKWLLAHTTETEREQGNREMEAFKQRMEAGKPALMEGLNRIYKVFSTFKSKNK